MIGRAFVDRMTINGADGKPVGNGAPGLIASALRRDFHDYAEIA